MFRRDAAEDVIKRLVIWDFVDVVPAPPEQAPSDVNCDRCLPAISLQLHGRDIVPVGSSVFKFKARSAHHEGSEFHRFSGIDSFQGFGQEAAIDVLEDRQAQFARV